MTKIAVESQYFDLPTALTSEATQCGPLVESQLAWSEVRHVGMIQLTARNLPFFTSLKNRVCGLITSASQSEP